MLASLTSYVLRGTKMSIYLKLFLPRAKEWTSNCISHTVRGLTDFRFEVTID